MAAVNQKILHEQTVEKTFIQLLSSEVSCLASKSPAAAYILHCLPPTQDSGVCVAGSNGLAAMTSLTSSRQAIGQLGGVEALVCLCGREESEVRAAGVQALAATLYEAPANCK